MKSVHGDERLLDTLPTPNHVKVLDAPEGEVVKGNRKRNTQKKTAKANKKLKTEIVSKEEAVDHEVYGIMENKIMKHNIMENKIMENKIMENKIIGNKLQELAPVQPLPAQTTSMQHLNTTSLPQYLSFTDFAPTLAPTTTNSNATTTTTTTVKEFVTPKPDNNASLQVLLPVSQAYDPAATSATNALAAQPLFQQTTTLNAEMLALFQVTANPAHIQMQHQQQEVQPQQQQQQIQQPEQQIQQQQQIPPQQVQQQQAPQQVQQQMQQPPVSQQQQQQQPQGGMLLGKEFHQAQNSFPCYLLATPTDTNNTAT